MPRLLIPDARGLAAAVDDWCRGGLVAFPTDTLYGLGADATDTDAIERLLAAKRRPAGSALPVLAADIDTLRPHAVFSPLAEQLAARFWPGPLTLVLKRSDHTALRPAVTAGRDTVGVRVPNHPLARALLETFAQNGSGLIAAPSANRSGQLPPTTPKHVAEAFADLADLPVIVGGRTPLGLDSTVLDLSTDTPRLLRLGMIGIAALEPFTGPLALPAPAPKEGALRVPLRLNALHAGPTEALLQFGPQVDEQADEPTGLIQKNLSPAGDLHEAAANLLVALHELNARPDLTAIAVQKIPDEGLGLVINDRLRNLDNSII